ncbi:MAG: acyl-CoA dehydrogenase [Alicyclobacillus sp.]|nr:acyl-CoA dehydrogenase [Alicyclobacillus sp.]
MDFSLTQEQERIRQWVRTFAQSRVAPLAAGIDERDELPRHLLAEMGELGLLGLPIPEAWGGVGADFLSYILAVEELSYASAAVGLVVAVHTAVGSFPILYFGTPVQQQRYLPRLASGTWLAAFALSEPEAGSDAAALRTRAQRSGAGYVLNGSKVFVTNGSFADLFCVFAVTDARRGSRGISAFLVERGTPGLQLGPSLRKMGMNGSGTCALVLEDVYVPEEQRLGEEGEGFPIAMRLLDGGRVGIAAQALGIARAAFDAAHAYTRTRKQFGQEIFQFQGVQFMLADMATQIEAARWLVYRAALLRQAGKPCTREAAMAKLFASDTAMRVTTDAVQLLGGYGYAKDYPVERYMRDAKVTQIYEGTNQIQRIVISRHLTR